MKFDPEVLVVRPRNRSAVDFPGLDTLSTGGMGVVVAWVPEPYVGTCVSVNYVDTVGALQEQVFAGLPGALFAPETQR